MARHYSKVEVSIPEGPSDPPYAVVTIDCDHCGVEDVRIHVAHLGTLLRVLADTVRDLHDDGTSEAMSPLVPSTPENKRHLREYLNHAFPEWKAERIRRRSS